MRFLSGIWKRKINGETLDYYPCPYMVGDILITTNTIKPEIRYPGTEWEELPEETYLMIASSKYPNKSTGGENEVTLIKDNLPNIKLGIDYYTSGNNASFICASKGSGIYVGTGNTNIIGSSKPINNMPQFYAIYGYRRIA